MDRFYCIEIYIFTQSAYIFKYKIIVYYILDSPKL